MRMLLESGLLMLAAVLPQSSLSLDRIWQGGSAPILTNLCELKIASWNIERGKKLQDIAAFLKQVAPTIMVLQEVDMNANRTGGKNVAEELALQLMSNYLFAAEFQELGQEAGNHAAYHGQALLTTLPISSARIIRYRNQTAFWKPRWYLPNWALFQRRLGGRVALAVELGTGPNQIVVYNVHLESRGKEVLRSLQMKEVIADTQRYPKETPIILAGDLNTQQLNSPVVKALDQAGFRKAVGQEISTTHGTAIDWIFVRGPLSFADGTVHRGVTASDHFPLTVLAKMETYHCQQ